MARAIARYHRPVIAVVLVALFVAIGLMFINADPPVTLPNHTDPTVLFSDPPAKSYEARTWALFDRWVTSPADNYQFWRTQSPVWVYPLALYYRVFGATYATLHVYSILVAAAALAVFLAVAARKLRGFPFLAAGALLAFNYYHFLIARSGLIEPLENLFVILTVYFLLLSRRHLAWLMAAEVAIVLAFLTKQSGLFLLPLVIGVGVLRYFAELRSPRRDGGVPRWLLRIAPVALFVVLCAGLAWYVRRPDYVRTIGWNYYHMVRNKDPNVGSSPLLDVLKRAFSTGTWTRGYLELFPVAGALALGELLHVIVRTVRRRATEWEIVASLWLAAAIGVLLITPHLIIHYRLILFPPVAVMAGAALASLRRLRPLRIRPRTSRTLLALAVCAEVAVHAVWYGRWASGRTYELASAQRIIQQQVGDRDAVFAGSWAGPLIFGTEYQWYYIKVIFNMRRAAIKSFGITHMLELEHGDLSGARILELFETEVERRQMLDRMRVRGSNVTLYSLPSPLGQGKRRAEAGSR